MTENTIKKFLFWFAFIIAVSWGTLLTILYNPNIEIKDVTPVYCALLVAYLLTNRYLFKY